MEFGPLPRTGATQVFYLDCTGVLVEGETISSGGVTCATTGITPSSVTPNATALEWNGVTYGAGKAIQFTITTTNNTITGLTLIPLAMTYTTNIGNVSGTFTEYINIIGA